MALDAAGSSDPFVLDPGDRYSRFRLIAWWRQERLAAARVMVVGAGALGNEVVKNLALLGVGHLVLVDFDTVEESNLTRSILFRAADAGQLKVEVAARMVREINPDVKVHPVAGDIIHDVGLGTIGAMDVVIGCLDNREARLWVNRCCWKSQTPWIDGGIQEISGVVKVFVPPDSACYECGMSQTDHDLINLRYSCPLLKREDIIQGKVPTAPTISSIIAGLETQEALKILHGLPVRSGAATVFSGETNQLYTTEYQRRPGCLSHETYPEAEPLDLAASTATLGTLLDRAADKLSGRIVLHLDRDLLASIACPNCDFKRDIFRPVRQVGLEEGRCAQCGEVCQTDIVYNLDAQDRFRDRTLASLGIPAYDIVRLSDGKVSRFFRLEGDRQRALGEVA